MAELDDVYTSAMAGREYADAAAAAAADDWKDISLRMAKALLWSWYSQNLDRSIKLRIWKFGISVAVRRLRGLFELLAGPPPDPDAA